MKDSEDLLSGNIIWSPETNNCCQFVTRESFLPTEGVHHVSTEAQQGQTKPWREREGGWDSATKSFTLHLYDERLVIMTPYKSKRRRNLHSRRQHDLVLTQRDLQSLNSINFLINISPQNLSDCSFNTAPWLFTQAEVWAVVSVQVSAATWWISCGTTQTPQQQKKHMISYKIKICVSHAADHLQLLTCDYLLTYNILNINVSRYSDINTTD